MHIDKFEEAILNCRFCFMCRHLSAIGNVRFTEVDTPRIRAAMLYGLRTGTNSFDDEDFVAALYRQELSRCCTRHCVNHFDENGLALAARADVVEAGKAPEAVKELAKKLADTAAWKISGKGDTALFLDPSTAADKASVAALAKLMKAAAPSGSYRTITGGSIGKALLTLGFLPEAKSNAQAFAEFLKDAGVKTLVVANPAAAHALKADYPDFGIRLTCEVFYIAGYLAARKVRFAKKAGPIAYLPSDFLRNYDGCGCASRLLAAIGAKCLPFGTNDEETYCCGEGAVVLDRLHPELVKALAEYVAARADDPKKDRFVVSSVYTKKALAKYGKLHVQTLEEVAASCL